MTLPSEQRSWIQDAGQADPGMLELFEKSSNPIARGGAPLDNRGQGKLATEAARTPASAASADLRRILGASVDPENHGSNTRWRSSG